MSRATVTNVSNAISAASISGASGIFTFVNGQNFLGAVAGSILCCAEKISVVAKVTALGAGTVLQINGDTSIDGVNFTTGGQLLAFNPINAIGDYLAIYNASAVSFLRLSWTLTGGTTTATLSGIDLQFDTN